ncbi:MAG TPA: hypothetical protein VK540_13950 [Polyangiaceae bacterium]|nr:hypothetical protein [Polyangiaceae bacterium]
MATLRTELFNARMTVDEVAMLRQLAEEDGISASDFVRQFVRRAYIERHGGLKGSKKARRRANGVATGRTLR